MGLTAAYMQHYVPKYDLARNDALHRMYYSFNLADIPLKFTVKSVNDDKAQPDALRSGFNKHHHVAVHGAHPECIASRACERKLLET